MMALINTKLDFVVPAIEQLKRFREHFASNDEYLDAMWKERDRLQGGASQSSGAWPYEPSEGLPRPLSDACRQTYTAVVEHLEAAKPSNVKQLRSVKP